MYIHSYVQTSKRRTKHFVVYPRCCILLTVYWYAMARHCRSYNDCLREGLKQWLKGGKIIWEDVVQALSSP